MSGSEHIVVFGAGNIGRSFIAPVFSRGGFEVVFADVDPTLVDALNRRKAYTVVEKSDDEDERHVTVAPVRAVRADDAAAVYRELSEARLAVTAVGGGAFDAVISAIGAGARSRTGPLDVILAENIHGAAARARKVLLSGGQSDQELSRRFGLVETSIGKMVPIMPRELRPADPLLCWAEPYNALIVDADGFTASPPAVPDLHPVSPIGPWVDRKLYVHNMGHAAAAYLGYRAHPEAEYLWEVLEDPDVLACVGNAMRRSAEALARIYPESFTLAELEEHVYDLLRRFRNRALEDTVYRVGRDLKRKLHRDDRLVGALRLVLKADLDPSPIVEALRAAPAFTKKGPGGEVLESDAELKRRFAEHGPEWLAHEVIGVDESEPELESLVLHALGPSDDRPRTIH